MHKDIKKHYKTSFLDIFFIKIFNKAYFLHQTPLKQDKKNGKKSKMEPTPAIYSNTHIKNYATARSMQHITTKQKRVRTYYKIQQETQQEHHTHFYAKHKKNI